MYEPQTFNLPALTGISQKQIDEHLKLYQGYVKHVNAIKARVKELVSEGKPENTYVISELWRRLGFEFNGMRLHEYYFGALEEGSKAFDEKSGVGQALIKQYGSYDEFARILTDVGSTRGSGWTTVYYDTKAQWFIIGWADEHHIGHLASLPVVLALDCWEHAYMVDYLPGERKKYIASYLENVNWEKVNAWFEKASA